MTGNPALRRLGLLTPALATIALLIGLPLILLIWISLLQKGGSSGVDWNAAPSLGNYIRLAWEEDFDGTMILNTSYLVILMRSVLQAALTTGLSLLFGLPVALWMAGLSRGQRDLMLLLITIPFWTNLLVRNYAWLIILREDGWLAQAVGSVSPIGPIPLLYNDLAVAIGLTYSFLPFMILPLYSTIERLDKSYLEASLDLGASQFQTFWKVTLPLTMPGIITGVILVFIPCLGMFLISDELGGTTSWMIGNVIQAQFGASNDWPFGSALSFALMLLTIIVLVMQWYYQNRSKGAH